MGSSRHLGRWSFEVAGGAGIEFAEVPTATVSSTESSDSGVATTTTVGDAARPGLFADGSLGFAHPVADSLDIVVRLGAHLTSIAYDNWFLSGTLGLRYNL